MLGFFFFFWFGGKQNKKIRTLFWITRICFDTIVVLFCGLLLTYQTSNLVVNIIFLVVDEKLYER